MESFYASGYVLSDTIEFEERLDDSGELNSVRIHGRIACSDNVTIRVHKILAVRRGTRNRHEVLGIDYSYHAFVGDGERDLFRYDNAHGDLSTLHRHLYDADGQDLGEEAIAPNQLPRLDFIIESAVDLVRAQTQTQTQNGSTN